MLLFKYKLIRWWLVIMYSRCANDDSHFQRLHLQCPLAIQPEDGLWAAGRFPSHPAARESAQPELSAPERGYGTYPVPGLSPCSDPWAKLVIAGLLGLFNSGWYAILQGNLYSSMPGQSGTVITLGNIVCIFGKFIPFGIGLAAEYFGLGPAMWLLLAGPIALLIGLPRMPHIARST